MKFNAFQRTTSVFKANTITSGLALVMAVTLAGCDTSAPSTRVSQKPIPNFTEAEKFPGGNATYRRASKRSFIYPGNHLGLADQMNFWSGLSFFRDPWVISPSSTKDRDGLGPLYNSRSCITCHHAGGRGPEATEGESYPTALLIRFGHATESNWVDPTYGGQLQTRGILLAGQYAIPSKTEKTEPPQVPAEGAVSLKYSYKTVTFDDGEQVTLRVPDYSVSQLSYGELAAETQVSPRYAPNLFGMGLLDAIPDKQLLALEDANDSDGNGISARYNRVPDLLTGELGIGRYGFKAKHPTLAQQIAAAFTGDIGIVNRLFPNETCTQSQQLCKQAAEHGNPSNALEIPDKLFALVEQFNRHLGVPPARNMDSPNVQSGRRLFYQLGCADCHNPSFTTKASEASRLMHDDPQLNTLDGLMIWPYTDLALHDMGEGLADGVQEFQASGREWRTPPLWGIGLQKFVLGKTRLLHDGRARNILEAVLWHGGEAAASQQAVLQLTKEEREQLIAFLKAI